MGEAEAGVSELGWAIVELFGHRKLAGRISEAKLAGGAFVRIDVPGKDGAFVATVDHGPAAIYGITWTTEDLARKAAVSCQPEPVTRYELPEDRRLTAAREAEDQASALLQDLQDEADSALEGGSEDPAIEAARLKASLERIQERIAEKRA